jgi:hypothetical protein
MNNETNGDTNMDRTNIDDFLTVRGFGGGWGLGGWGGGGQGVFASPGANAVRLNRNAEITKSENSCNRHLFGQALDQIQNSFENQTRAGEFQQVCNKLAEVGSSITDNQFRAELRSADKATFIGIDQKLDKLADCCCEQKVEAAKAETRSVERFCELKAGQAEIKATLAANKEIAELRQQLTVEQTLNRQYCCPPPVKCVDPCCHG